MNNKYEVGFTPDDNNNIRLPGSVQPEPMRGDSDYHHLNMAVPGKLDAADTGGVVGKVTVDYSGMGQEGTYKPSLNSNVSVKNEGTSLNTTASNENLSKKYKYPQFHQSVNPLDDPRVTFNDHS